MLKGITNNKTKVLTDRQKEKEMVPKAESISFSLPVTLSHTQCARFSKLLLLQLSHANIAFFFSFQVD